MKFVVGKSYTIMKLDPGKSEHIYFSFLYIKLEMKNLTLVIISFKVIYKVTDLGYAKHLDHTSVANSFVGTMKYVVCSFYKVERNYLYSWRIFHYLMCFVFKFI